MDSNRSDMVAFYEAPCHQGLCDKWPLTGCQEWLFREVKFIRQICSFERPLTRRWITKWLIFFSQVDKSKVLLLNLLMKTSDGTALPQKSFNYFQLWQTIISAQLCCTSVKANKAARRDWGSLLVFLSTPFKDMCVLQVCNHWRTFVTLKHLNVFPFIHFCMHFYSPDPQWFIYLDTLPPIHSLKPLVNNEPSSSPSSMSHFHVVTSASVVDTDSKHTCCVNVLVEDSPTVDNAGHYKIAHVRIYCSQ